MTGNFTITRLSIEDSKFKPISDYIEHNSSLVYLSLQNLRLIAKSYGAKAYCIVLYEGGVIQGVMLYYLSGRWLEGKRLFCPRNGYLVKSPDLVSKLLFELERYAEIERVMSMQICSQQQDIFKSDIISQKTYLGINLEIPIEELWKKLRDKTRNSIRKSQKYQLVVKNDDVQLDSFYGIYSERMKFKKVAIHSKQYFKNIVNASDVDYDIYTAEYESKPIASILILYSKTHAFYAYSGVVSGFEKMCPVQGLLWAAIEKCYKKNIKFFDMGESSEGSGTYKFKIWFGAEPYSIWHLLTHPSSMPILHRLILGVFSNVMKLYRFAIYKMGFSNLVIQFLIREKSRGRLI